jgi:hypothetical protein
VNEKDLLELWSRARLHIILSQLAPTFLLTVTITALSLAGGFGGPVAVRIASAGILLASGILGFLAQFSSAGEASAIAADLGTIENPSAVTKRIIGTARWTTVVKFVTPAIFVVIYLAILWSLFISPLLR